MIDNKNKLFHLDKLIFFLPFSIIIGNAAININAVLIGLIYILILVFNRQHIFDNAKIFLIFFIFLVPISIGSFNSVNQSISLISLAGIFRYFLIMLAIILCLEKDKNFLNNFSKAIFIAIIFTTIDTLIQFSFGKDILGYEIQTSHGNRLSGPFRDELIVGSYLTKMLFISMFFFLTKKFNNQKLFYLILIFTTVLLSNERAVTIMLFFSLIIYFSFSSFMKIKTKLTILITFILSIFLIMNFNSSFKSHFIENTFDQIGLTQNNSNRGFHNSFWDSRWGAHYLTALEIFKTKPLLGSGLRTFRLECSNKKFEKIKSAQMSERCNTHPHNIYFEILSETGLITLILFLILMIIFLYKFLFNLFVSKIDYEKNLLLLMFNFILFFPIQTTGSLFSTWNGIFYWVCLAITIDHFKKIENVK